MPVLQIIIIAIMVGIPGAFIGYTAYKNITSVPHAEPKRFIPDPDDLDYLHFEQDESHVHFDKNYF